MLLPTSGKNPPIYRPRRYAGEPEHAQTGSDAVQWRVGDGDLARKLFGDAVCRASRIIEYDWDRPR